MFFLKNLSSFYLKKYSAAGRNISKAKYKDSPSVIKNGNMLEILSVDLETKYHYRLVNIRYHCDGTGNQLSLDH